jgi:hypothetical protein
MFFGKKLIRVLHGILDVKLFDYTPIPESCKVQCMKIDALEPFSCPDASKVEKVEVKVNSFELFCNLFSGHADKGIQFC